MPVLSMRTGAKVNGRSALAAIAMLVAWSPRAGAASGLATIATELSRGIGAPPPTVIVVVSPLASDTPAPKAEELGLRLASLVAGQLGGAARVHPRSASLAVAQAAAAKVGALVYVEVEIARGQLRATADLYPVPSNSWDRLRTPVPAPRAHGFASAPLDAEARTFLTPLSLGRPVVHKAHHDVKDVLSVACGDADGDGANELELVGRGAIALGHVTGERFVVSRSAPWHRLAARSPVPMREPLGASAIVPEEDGTGGALLAATTDYGPVSLSRDLLAAAPAQGFPVLAGTELYCARPDAAASAYEGNLHACPIRKTAPGVASKSIELASPHRRYDAVAATELVAKDGSSVALVAARDPEAGLALRAGERTARLPEVGAQLAVGDLDEDGDAEVVTTTDHGDEVVSVSTWTHGELVARFRIPVPSSVRAVAVCPPDGGGPHAVVVALDGEVWLVR